MPSLKVMNTAVGNTTTEALSARLAADLPGPVLDSLTEVIGLDDAIAAADRVLAGGVHGRIVVDLRG